MMGRERRVRFEKWEGLGNDFVLVEEDAALWADEQVRAVCDRRRGVGADGVLFVRRGTETELPRMVVRNADGSRPEMCGNGIRCVAGYLLARSEAAEAELGIETDAGVRTCRARAVGAGGDARVEVAVEMGPAKVEGSLLVELDGRTHAFTKVNVGNPHAITFEPYEEAAVDVVGPAVERSPAGGTNVEFCRVVRGDAAGDLGASVPRIDVVVWERGVGRTQACGTGACAVAAAACAAGMFEYGKSVAVRLPGGELSIAIAAGSHEATMTGPARRAFTGELALPEGPGRP